MINHLFGEEMIHQEPGLVRWSYRVNPAHFNPTAALHGGVISALLDTAMGHAVFATSMSEPGRYNVAISLHVDFLQALRRSGELIAIEGRVTRYGKRIAFSEGEVRNEVNEVVARAIGVHAILHA